MSVRCLNRCDLWRTLVLLIHMTCRKVYLQKTLPKSDVFNLDTVYKQPFHLSLYVLLVHKVTILP